MEKDFDVIVIGGGHAGCESALATSRLGKRTLLCVTEEGTVGYMPCNPHIGGTAKGHLVREVDALGGEMGVNADKSLLQLKMLNTAKGAAVQSLRGQADKDLYHRNMLQTIKNQENLTFLVGEAEEILVQESKIVGVIIAGVEYKTKAVIVATGVYLRANIVIGEEVKEEGPSGFLPSNKLSQSLLKLGLPLRRFKTGTPARVLKSSIDFDLMEREDGDEDIYSFSFLTDKGVRLTEQLPCYLTYTNENTHKIIEDNIDKAPMYNGMITGVGPRYCPSIESKIMRFRGKPRHQIFVEPETREGDLMYIQGMSTSMPKDVQLLMYHSIKGLEHCEIVKWAYAIEYDALDGTCLFPSLRVKTTKGLYCAGQVNGTSGYEEAAAQGLMAGINASREIDGLPPVVLSRNQAYIGVLIDDIATKPTEEPYRMMTARAEYRLTLRQDNADFRLTELGREIGLVSDERYAKFQKRKAEFEELLTLFDKWLSPKEADFIMDRLSSPRLKSGFRVRDLAKRTGVTYKDIAEIPMFAEYDRGVLRDTVTAVKYEGYVANEQTSIDTFEKLEEKPLSPEIDYSSIPNLRIEAREKLDRIKPLTLGQACRISGVSPADINILIAYLATNKKK